MNSILEFILVVLGAYGLFVLYFNICDRLGWPNGFVECWTPVMNLIREPLGAWILGVTLCMERGGELE